MARVTVEDCVQRVPNRFELVMVAAQRSREISAGAEPRLERDNDKNPVVALREIADVTINLDGLRESLVKGLQRQVEVDEPEDEVLEVMADEQALAQAMMAGAAQAAEADEETAEIGADAETDEAGDEQA